jgi:hypothetical protein
VVRVLDSLLPPTPKPAEGVRGRCSETFQRSADMPTTWILGRAGNLVAHEHVAADHLVVMMLPPTSTTALLLLL